MPLRKIRVHCQSEIDSAATTEDSINTDVDESSDSEKNETPDLERHASCPLTSKVQNRYFTSPKASSAGRPISLQQDFTRVILSNFDRSELPSNIEKPKTKDLITSHAESSEEVQHKFALVA
jgi:hypothetical protein